MGRKTYQNNLAGFTLIELLVVIMVLSILFIGLVLTMNPKKQMDKARDAQRQHDLEQIKSALDMYYNDHLAYPAPPLPSGEWKEGINNIYMKQVPKDPNGSIYTYYASGTSPQWAILYATLSEGTNSCPLKEKCNCTPNPSKLACVLLGNVNCSSINNLTCLPL